MNSEKENRLMDIADDYVRDIYPVDLNFIKGTYKINKKTFRNIDSAIAECERIKNSRNF